LSKHIRKATRRRFTAEEKIRIVLEGVRGGQSSDRAVPQRGDPALDLLQVVQSLPGFGQKNCLTRETKRDVSSDEVRRLKEENEALKKAVAETVLKNQKRILATHALVKPHLPHRVSSR
jgi:transposase